MDTGGKLAASTTVFVKNILLLPLSGISSVTCPFTSLCYLMISQLRIHFDSAIISQGYPLFIPLVKKIEVISFQKQPVREISKLGQSGRWKRYVWTNETVGGRVGKDWQSCREPRGQMERVGPRKVSAGKREVGNGRGAGWEPDVSFLCITSLLHFSILTQWILNLPHWGCQKSWVRFPTLDRVTLGKPHLF